MVFRRLLDRKRTSLTDIREVDRAASEITVQGARYPQHLQQMTGR
jgi:hypothetical protein